MAAHLLVLSRVLSLFLVGCQSLFPSHRATVRGTTAPLGQLYSILVTLLRLEDLWVGLQVHPTLHLCRTWRAAARYWFSLQIEACEVPIMKNNIVFKPTVILQLQNMLEDESQTEPLQGRDYERGAMTQRYLFCRRVRLYGGVGKDSDGMRTLITGSSLWNKLCNFNQMEQDWKEDIMQLRKRAL